MSERTPLRLLALPVGAVALLLAGASSGVPGDASRAGSSRVALPTNGGPTPSRETTGPSPTLQPKPSRVDTTRPASTETPPPDPHIGQSPLVESSASEATPFECALDGAAFAECSSPTPRAGALNTFAQTEDRTLAVDDVMVTEGDAGTITAGFSVTLSAASKSIVTVNYATAGVSATPDPDFQSTTGTLTFDPGVTSQPINVAVNGDVLDEADETFTVTFSSPRGATLLDDVGTGTITDDDPEPTLSVSDITVAEGDAGTTDATFNVTLSAASGQQVTVDFATKNDTASGADYTAAMDTLTFVPGDVTETVTISVTGDLLDEADETFFVRLSGASNATFADGQGVATITDDDPLPSLSIGDHTVLEGGGNATFTVTLSPASGRSVTVDYTTVNDTASAGSDYTTTAGVLTFAAGETSKTIVMPLTSDTLDEPNEDFLVYLSNAPNATLADGQGIGTITDDDDAASSLAVNDATVDESNTGSVNATFTVTLNAPSGKAVSVDYGTADGTATATADYTATNGTLTFAAGETTKTVEVSVNGDTLDEVDETFTLNLASASNATIGDGIGLGTITDDDASPSLAIGDIAVAEGDGGTSNASFTVSLSAVSGRTVTVNYTTANGTATTPADYANTSGSLSFAPAETAKAVTVPVKGDVLDEENETFVINLSDAVDASLSDSQGLGTVTDDDPLPALSVNDVAVVEGNSGTVNATFTITLSPVSGRAVTVNYATANDSAAAPADYRAMSEELTFAAGETTKTVTVLVNGDTLDEVGETYTLNLSATPTNATIADGEGVGTIIDNDGGPSVFINDVTVVEGNSGTVNATFSVSLSASSGQPVSVGYATADGTAAAGSDYTAVGGNLSFATGQTTRTLTVPVKSDALDEIDESFVVNLSEAVNADIADGEGAGKITDDDPLPLLSVGDVTLAEGDAGTSPAIFTVTLTRASGRTVTVGYATANGTAIAPDDYEPVTGILTFEPGQTTKTLGVPVQGDSVIEADETFVVNLSNVVAGSVSDGQGVGTIANDDTAPPPPPLPGPPPPPPPAPDTTSPGEVGNVRVKAGDETTTISWANPSDADFQGVSVRRISAGKSIQNLAVYEGVGTTFTERGLKNGSRYRYRIKTRDRAGNTSAGIVVTALPKSALLGPAKGAIVTAPPLLRWAPFPRATYYNAQLYLIRGGSQTKAQVTTKVLSIWPSGTRYKLSKTWRYRGKRYRLVPGRYRWYVWPGLGKRSANRYGPMLGESTFTVKAKRTR